MSKAARIAIGLVMIVWGLVLAGSIHRVPTPAQARWARAKAEAKARGEDPSTVSVPPVAERYTVPPQWIIAAVGITLLGTLLIVSAGNSSSDVNGETRLSEENQ